MTEEKKAPAGSAASKTKANTNDGQTTAERIAAGTREGLNGRISGSAADMDTSGPADISAGNAISPNASGAIIEPDALARVDERHPSIDNNPRKNTTQDMNRVDMNTATGPDVSAAAITAEALGMEPEADPNLVPSGPMAQPSRATKASDR